MQFGCIIKINEVNNPKRNQIPQTMFIWNGVFVIKNAELSYFMTIYNKDEVGGILGRYPDKCYNGQS
jgi:hypothetical protein